MKISLENKKEFIDLVGDLEAYAKVKNWSPIYDSDSDSLSLISPNISKTARVKYLLDNEIAFYVNKNSQIEGVFVEYFKSNFISHTKGLKTLIQNLPYAKEKSSGLIKFNKAKTQQILPALENRMKQSLAERIKFKD